MIDFIKQYLNSLTWKKNGTSYSKPTCGEVHEDGRQ